MKSNLVGLAVAVVLFGVVAQSKGTVVADATRKSSSVAQTVASDWHRFIHNTTNLNTTGSGIAHDGLGQAWADGLYELNTDLMIRGEGSTVYGEVRVNGAQYQRFGQYMNYGKWGSLGISSLVELNAGDTVDVHLIGEGGERVERFPYNNGELKMFNIIGPTAAVTATRKSSSASQSLNPSTWNRVTYDTTSLNTTGFSNYYTGLGQAWAGGLYELNTELVVRGKGDEVYGEVRINGVPHERFGQYVENGEMGSLGTSSLVVLTGGDTVDVYLYGAGGETVYGGAYNNGGLKRFGTINSAAAVDATRKTNLSNQVLDSTALQRLIYDTTNLNTTGSSTAYDGLGQAWVDGLYEFNLELMVSGMSQEVYGIVAVNGTIYEQFGQFLKGGFPSVWGSLSTRSLVELNVGDTVDVYLRGAGGEVVRGGVYNNGELKLFNTIGGGSIPETSTLAIWSLLGLCSIGIGWRRRKA